MNLDMKKCRILAIAGVACDVASFFYLGMTLAALGFAFSLVSFLSLKKYVPAHPEDIVGAKTFRLAKIGMIFGVVMFVASFATALFLLPALMENVSSGGAPSTPMF